ncbi:hypothetical protein C8R45DRAFT_1081665 [Mycena sanguinolenta]|nr:hypothetical protein C8R45DRAFT_1081665 [Mycena sanguinolenta]
MSKAEIVVEHYLVPPRIDYCVAGILENSTLSATRAHRWRMASAGSVPRERRRSRGGRQEQEAFDGGIYRAQPLPSSLYLHGGVFSPGESNILRPDGQPGARTTSLVLKLALVLSGERARLVGEHLYAPGTRDVAAVLAWLIRQTLMDIGVGLLRGAFRHHCLHRLIDSRLLLHWNDSVHGSQLEVIEPISKLSWLPPSRSQKLLVLSLRALYPYEKSDRGSISNSLKHSNGDKGMADKAATLRGMDQSAATTIEICTGVSASRRPEEWNDKA